jgi:DNA-binding response OmpR family regulator
MTSKPIRLLLVEDDWNIAEPLIFGLQNEGLQVLHAPDAKRGLALARSESPDVILLDVMLPGPDGFATMRTLRAESSVPILMVTARGQEMDRVMGLELGADDYIVKPFSFRELLARVRAVLRRRAPEQATSTAPPDRLTIGKIVLDRSGRQAWRDGRPLELSQREFDLLQVLMEHCGQAIARQDLLDLVWGKEWIGDTRTLDVHVRWLREKLEKNPSAPRYLLTLRGFGYRFVDPDAPPTDTP